MTDLGRPLNFGAFITPAASTPADVIALAELADRSGLDFVTFQDHPYQPAFLDTWTLLSYAAARTERIGLAGNVLNLPLRHPAVLARSVASLDRLSGGRIELGLGAGAFWEAIEAMGGPRRSGGQAVEALEEALTIVRELWATEQRGGVRLDGEHYRVHGAKRGPAPAHPVEIWLGAYKPRMLSLVGRRADGWLPSLGYLGDGDLVRGQQAIDEAATSVGRNPRDIRRLLNLPPLSDENAWVEQLVGFALDGIDTFIVAADDATTIERLAVEVAPAVRAVVDAERAAGRQQDSTPVAPEPSPPSASEPDRATPPDSDSQPEATEATPAIHRADATDTAQATNATDATDATDATGQWRRLGFGPTPPPAAFLSVDLPWQEESRPRRRPTAQAVYTDRGRAVGRHLIDVHDHLRRELGEVRDVLDQVRRGAAEASAARSVINDLTMRQNDWTLGAYCASYCRLVTGHHSLEDASIFPHLRSEDDLVPVLDRLSSEHETIHEVLELLDRRLVAFIGRPDDFSGVQSALDLVTDTLLSHLAYEEDQLVEPLARLGFYPDQV